MYKWIEINLDAIKENYLKVRDFVREETKILGVVKADAYGHGIIEVSRELENQGIDYLGVTEISEGIQLREAGINVPILVFGPFLPEDIYYIKEFDLTVSLADLKSIKLIKDKGVKVKTHIKLETGLGRTGIKYTQLDEMVGLLKNDENIEVEGIYTHLATAMWDDLSFTMQQYSEFLKAIEFIESKGFIIPVKHICNSAALAKFPEMHLDMVRAGTILYGQEVAGKQDFHGQLINAWALKGQITYLNELPKGHSIGYERAHILKKNSKTAIVPVGFSHGFSVEPIPRPGGVMDLIKILGKTILRYLDHSRVKTYVKIRDKYVPIIGKVGMQMTILDVSDIPDIKIGEIVELPGRRTNISPTLPKVFMKEGKPIRVRKITEKYEEISMAAK